MAVSKLKITIHNPNTAEDISRMLVDVFAEVILARVEKQLQIHEDKVGKISPAV